MSSMQLDRWRLTNLRTAGAWDVADGVGDPAMG